MSVSCLRGPLDCLGCNPSSYWAYNWPLSLCQLTSHLNLVDIWWNRHPLEHQFTWHRPNGSQASHLDMFWLSSHLSDYVHQIDVLPFFRSDHSYVFLWILLPSMPKHGLGTWKFNSSLLKNDDYVKRIRDFWTELQREKDSFPSLAVWWDAGKKRIKAMTQSYSSRQACARRSRVKSLENTLYHLERRKRKARLSFVASSLCIGC